MCIHFEYKDQDIGKNKPFKIGETVDGTPRMGYPSNGSEHLKISDPSSKLNAPREVDDRLQNIVERIEEIIVNNAALDNETTNPGIVVTHQTGLPIDLYWTAVREVVKLELVKTQLNAVGAVYKGFKSGRGIIGASAAIGWGSNQSSNNNSNNNSLDHTYELITYRNDQNIGTARKVNPKAVQELERRFPSTFNNYDFDIDHITITPNSPCPVLFGVRGDNLEELHNVFTFLKPNSESIAQWLIFDTNQGTDDHLIKTTVPEINPYSSVIITGRVYEIPKTILGGHVLFTLEELNPETKHNNKKCQEDSLITCAAYEPTKGFREIIKGLLTGDIISVYGGVRTEPKTINIEKFEILHMIKNKIKEHNPHCSNCGRMMKSKGHAKGYRCRNPECNSHKHIMPEDMVQVEVARKLMLGKYEVPVSARRHLSKPLKRI